MNEIKHIGKYFILGKQGGRDVMRISESQLLECLQIFKAEMKVPVSSWDDVIEYLQLCRE